MSRRIVLTVAILVGVLAVSLPKRWRERLQFGVRASGVQNNITTFYATYKFHTLKHPAGITIVSGGGVSNLYIADAGNNRIEGFDMIHGGLSTVAGNGTAGYLDNTTATNAEFNVPTGLSPATLRLVPNRNPPPVYWEGAEFYVNDTHNYVIRRVCLGPACAYGYPPVGVSTYAGNSHPGHVDGPTGTAEFEAGGGVSYATAGMYVADSNNNVIRLISGGSVTTYAGTGTWGYVNGARANARFAAPSKVTVDSSGNMYIADMGNNAIRKIDTSGNVTTFAGSLTGQGGDTNGQGTAARFCMPMSIVFNSADNNLYVADGMNNEIRKIDLAGNVSTYAGSASGAGGLVDGSLTQARFNCPMDLVILSGFMYITDTLNNAIRRIDMANSAVSTYIS